MGTCDSSGSCSSALAELGFQVNSVLFACSARYHGSVRSPCGWFTSVILMYRVLEVSCQTLPSLYAAAFRIKGEETHPGYLSHDIVEQDSLEKTMLFPSLLVCRKTLAAKYVFP